MIDINEYTQEKHCIYKDEEYLVRDNGAVLRKARPTCRVRKLDNEWTFGKENAKTGYLEIASERVHRIVAMAFLGDPPTKEHIVDHIDTNRQNNRPNNLRWITRLENVVLNEITRKRIEYRTGVNIFDFLANPAKYRDCFDDPDFNWMRSVTETEAKACLENTRNWIQNKERKTNEKRTLKLGEWIYKSHDPYMSRTQHYSIQEESNITASLTAMAKQKNWKIPTEFKCCPKFKTENAIGDYLNNLSEEKVFSINQYGESRIVKYAPIGDDAIVVITLSPKAIKPFALAKITFEETYFLHTSLGTFFTEEGVEKQYALAQGLEWTGGDTLDDYC